MPFPHCINLDVDGLEYEILGAASQLFSNPSLRTILLEVTGEFSNPTSEAARVKSMLDPYSFGIENMGNETITRSGEPIRNAVFSR